MIEVAEDPPARGAELHLHRVVSRSKSKDVEGSPKHRADHQVKRFSAGGASVGGEDQGSRPTRPKLLNLPFLEEIKARRVGKICSIARSKSYNKACYIK